MSLIHDALKKAQGEEKAPVGSGTANIQEAIGSHRPPLNKRTIVLAVILLLALGYFTYSRLFSSPEPSDVPKPTGSAGAAPSATASGVGPSDPVSLKKKAYDLYKNNDLSGAWANISAMVKLAPNDAEAWNNYGLIAKKQGDLVEAQKGYDKALELKPDYTEAMNNKAVLLLAQGDGGGARELLEKAIALQPAYPEANFNMGLVYDKAGEKKKAQEYYRRFLEVGGDFPSTVVEEVRNRVMELDK